MKMQFDFTGKRVLITGSTLGIGRSAAEGFHALGATVAVNGRTETSVQRTIREMGPSERFISAPGDVSIASERQVMLETAIATMGGLDVLINNAGRGDDCLIKDVTEDYWQRMFDLNLKGAFFATQACVPALKETRGCIINVASGLGLMGGPPGTAVYSATKGALIQMTRMLSLSLARDGVRVNTLCPGWIETPMIKTENERTGDNALYNYIEQTTPLGRIGQVEEITGAMLYLAAPFASFATGAIFTIDGGLTSGH